tara:strand:- start:1035 stop:1391 length:357 start_codon:yes stop_codon:yes gene_type:complete
MNQKEAFFDTTYIMQDSSVGDEFTTEQASSSNGMWLKLFSRLDQEGKSQVYYQVHGCPHLIAITSMLISDLQNKSIQELETHNIKEYAEIINLPKTKQDRLFLLEDALKGCIKHLKRA